MSLLLCCRHINHRVFYSCLLVILRIRSETLATVRFLTTLPTSPPLHSLCAAPLPPLSVLASGLCTCWWLSLQWSSFPTQHMACSLPSLRSLLKYHSSVCPRLHEVFSDEPKEHSPAVYALICIFLP